jgi:geranylgeranyl pyrophosphate synthase
MTHQTSLQIKDYKSKIDTLIVEYLSKFKKKNLVTEMFEYVLINDSKKLRSILALIVAKSLGLSAHQIESYLIGVEVMHTYTLVHDDLPSIDNDDLRRGKLTAHKKFGEANAILLGDGLQSLAFELFSEENESFDPRLVLKVTNEFSKLIGIVDGVAYGQILDIEIARDHLNLEEIFEIHLKKTAIFFGFCASFPAILANKGQDMVDELREFGIQYGLAFQLLDDLEDFQTKYEKSNICTVIGYKEAKKRYSQQRVALKSRFDALNQFVSLTLKEI